MSETQKIVINRSTEEINGEVGKEEAYIESIRKKEEEASVAEEKNKPESQEPAAKESKPSWLPEKFATPEDMAAAYKELERKVGTKIPEPTKAPDSSSLEPFHKEFSETGTVSEDSIKKIVNLGYPESFVRSYIQGQQSLMEAQNNSIMSRAGGREAYSQMVEWAAENLDEGEIEAFNSTVSSGNTSSINLAVDGLKSRWYASTGVPGKTPLVLGETSTAASSGAYRSIAEVVQAMKDPRYDKDPAYRKEVESRVALSNVLGA